MLPHSHFYFTVTLHLRLMSLSGFPFTVCRLGQTTLILLATFIGVYVLAGGKGRGKLALPCTHRLHGVVHSELKLKHIESRILRSVVSWLLCILFKTCSDGAQGVGNLFISSQVIRRGYLQPSTATTDVITTLCIRRRGFTGNDYAMRDSTRLPTHRGSTSCSSLFLGNITRPFDLSLLVLFPSRSGEPPKTDHSGLQVMAELNDGRPSPNRSLWQ